MGAAELFAAIGFEPATDVDLRMGFAAIVPGAALIGSILVPLEYGQFRVTAVDDDPSHRTLGFFAADFTSINSVDHSNPRSCSCTLFFSSILFKHLQIERRLEQALHGADTFQRPLQRRRLARLYGNYEW